MTLNINVKYLNPACKLEMHGDWIDLKSAIDYTFTKDKEYLALPLGLCMELPTDFEAIAAPRSSLYGKFRLLMTNPPGVIDNAYKGDKDQWHCLLLHLRKRSDDNVTIKVGERICQFRIQPRQMASWKTKLKWIFCSGFTITEVDHLGNNNRGGIGSTDKSKEIK